MDASLHLSGAGKEAILESPRRDGDIPASPRKSKREKPRNPKAKAAPRPRAKYERSANGRRTFPLEKGAGGDKEDP